MNNSLCSYPLLFWTGVDHLLLDLMSTCLRNIYAGQLHKLINYITIEDSK